MGTVEGHELLREYVMARGLWGLELEIDPAAFDNGAEVNRAVPLLSSDDSDRLLEHVHLYLVFQSEEEAREYRNSIVPRNGSVFALLISPDGKTG